MEAALITPIVALLLFGIIEFGLLLNRHLAASNASREGARAAAASTNDGGFENRVVTRIQDSLAGINDSDVRAIVVYEADPSDGQPRSGADLDDLTTCDSIASSHCTYWTPDGSGGWDKAGDGAAWFDSLEGCYPTISSGSDARSRIGVRVVLEYDAFTPLVGQIIGSHREVADKTVMRVEPRRGASPCP